ncbi:MAG: hypothetical protein NZ898_17410, partial [Myxococcota bacterium]|nr:hypothetical protein [Myxococcota bacterium]MDW8364170.1 hypothetical protein [Myxococcales bacterium]
MDGGRTLVVARPAPFAERVVREVPSSTQIGAIVRELAGEASDYAVVCVDGEVVPPSRWSEPIAGRTAAIVVRPRGGDALRIALSFGLSVLSLGVGAWAGPALASALG